MANSTQVMTDSAALFTNNFSSASLSKAAAADVQLNSVANAAYNNLTRAKAELEQVAANCDAGDSQLTLCNNIIGTLS